MQDGEVGTEGIVDELLRSGEFRFSSGALRSPSRGKECDENEEGFLWFEGQDCVSKVRRKATCREASMCAIGRTSCSGGGMGPLERRRQDETDSGQRLSGVADSRMSNCTLPGSTAVAKDDKEACLRFGQTIEGFHMRSTRSDGNRTKPLTHCVVMPDFPFVIGGRAKGSASGLG